MIPTLIVISIISFTIIQLPPGDFLTSTLVAMSQSGESISQERMESLRARYGLDKPIYVQYLKWISGLARGDFGYSYEWHKPVNQLIWGRLGLTFAISLITLLFTWLIAFPIGLYSATHQYSIVDYVASFIGFIGLAIPNFMLALIFMWIGYASFGVSLGGLFSSQYIDAPFNIAKLIDMLKHLWIPVIVIGTAGTAGLIRIFRANILDEIKKAYVVTARSKGLKEIRLLFKYPVRIASIPFVSTIGWVLPGLISGATITAVVLSLPTTGPMLLRALKSQDMYLAGSFVMLLSFLTVVGTLVSDILLAAVDPRIRYQRVNAHEKA